MSGRDFRQQAFRFLESSLLEIARLVPVNFRADTRHSPVRVESVEQLKLPFPFSNAEQQRGATSVNPQLRYVPGHLGALPAEAPKIVGLTHRLDQTPALLQSIVKFEEPLFLCDLVVAAGSDSKGILRPVAHRFHLQVAEPTINHTGFKQTS